MKKLLFYSLLLSFIILSIHSVYGATIPSPLQGDAISNFNRLTSLIKPATILTVSGTTFWGGFTILTAGDSDDQYKKGAKIIGMAIVGIIIIFLSPSAVDLVGIIFGVNLIEFI